MIAVWLFTGAGGGGRGVATVENSLLAPQKVQRRITM